MSELDQFKATYFAECSELLAETEENLSLLEQGSREADLLHAVFRAVHSIKGGAGAFGFDDLVTFAHSFETLLDLLRESKIESSPDVIGVCIRAIDVVSDLVAAARDGTALEASYGAEIKSKIEQLSGAGSGPSPMESFDDIDFTPVQVVLDDVPEAPESAAEARPAASSGPPKRTWTIRFKPHRALFERANEPLLLFRELASLAS